MHANQIPSLASCRARLSPPLLARNNSQAAPPVASGLAGLSPAPAPKPARGQIKKGDRLAICGDSITEQKQYSRIMEDYLTMCVPELGVSVRQFRAGVARKRPASFAA